MASEIWGLFQDSQGVQKWVNLTVEAASHQITVQMLIDAYQAGGFTLVRQETRDSGQEPPPGGLIIPPAAGASGCLIPVILSLLTLTGVILFTISLF